MDISLKDKLTNARDNMNSLLEVCVDSYASAMAAIRGGADRLELCSSLPLGGLTPSPALLKQIKAETDIPINCLIRSRAGDFLYSQKEISLMSMEIEILRDYGADGFVIGALTDEGHLDRDALKQLIFSAKDRKITLNRCFDVSVDLMESFFIAQELSVDTILTSGGSISCVQGMSMLKRLINKRQKSTDPIIMIGAGVNAEAVKLIRSEIPAANTFHMSGKMLLESRMKFRKIDVPMGTKEFDEWHIIQTDENAVRAVKEILMAGSKT